MNIIDFYKELSKLLERTREKYFSKEEAQEKLSELLQKAEDHDLHVNINPNILEHHNLVRLDDERSYSDPESGWDTDSYSDFSSNTSTSY
jgi:hypothetical protein